MLEHRTLLVIPLVDDDKDWSKVSSDSKTFEDLSAKFMQRQKITVLVPHNNNNIHKRTLENAQKPMHINGLLDLLIAEWKTKSFPRTHANNINHQAPATECLQENEWALAMYSTGGTWVNAPDCEPIYLPASILSKISEPFPSSKRVELT